MCDQCLEPEQLAVYLEGVGGDQERRQVEAHLKQCGDCRQVIALILYSERAIPAPARLEKLEGGKR